MTLITPSTRQNCNYLKHMPWQATRGVNCFELDFVKRDQSSMLLWVLLWDWTERKTIFFFSFEIERNTDEIKSFLIQAAWRLYFNCSFHLDADCSHKNQTEKTISTILCTNIVLSARIFSHCRNEADSFSLGIIIMIQNHSWRYANFIV